MGSYVSEHPKYVSTLVNRIHSKINAHIHYYIFFLFQLKITFFFRFYLTHTNDLQRNHITSHEMSTTGQGTPSRILAFAGKMWRGIIIVTSLISVTASTMEQQQQRTLCTTYYYLT